MDPERPSRIAAILGHATWVIAAVAFIRTLGGFHPSDVTRDRILGLAGVLVVAVNVPVAAWLWRSAGLRDARAEALRTGAAIVLRLAFTAWLLWFARGISHGGWQRHDAWRHCAATIDAWTPGLQPRVPCSALHMCANEAVLRPEQQTKLRQMIRATDGCAEP